MKLENKYPFTALLALSAIALVLMNGAGCIGYRIGSMLPDKYQTVAVPTFANRTSEPLIENETTSATISEIQMDGSLRIADVETADAILRVKLRDFELHPIAYSDERSRLAKEYRMHITASIQMSDRDTGEVIVESPFVRGSSDFLVGGDLSSSKKSAIPNAARDLAHNIVERIVEIW